METENFRNNIVVDKTFFNQDQTVKGKEVYKYNKQNELPMGSEFYGPDGSVLSTYKYEYQDTLKSKSFAYAGTTDELLRIERFQYDPRGNMVRKMILDENEVVQKSFMFGHDQYGNEVKMVVTDPDDNIILSETYEIVTVDENKRWIEKYGYVNDNKKPSTFYHRIMNDK